MLGIVLGVSARIISNSCLNVFQKTLTSQGNRASVVNYYTYLGLVLLSFFLVPFLDIRFSQSLLINFVIMGILGALGNYFIIKALSIGELSGLAPINSYKPIIALLIGFLYLGELPSLSDIIGIFLIIAGTYFLYTKNLSFSKIAIIYRGLALIFSGAEAVFIKKIILLTNVPASFMLWAVSGLIFSALFVVFSDIQNIKMPSKKFLILLVSSVAVMQLTTNYVFSKMSVSSSLALFQLSTLLSVFLGVNLFHEKGIIRKATASVIMIAGAVIIILS